MPSKTHEPEEIIGTLRAVEIALGQGRTTAEDDGLKVDQARGMKNLEKENARLRLAISDLTLDKLILQEAAKGNL